MAGYTLVAPFGDDLSYDTFSPLKYDASGGDPAAWRLWVILTAPGQPLMAAIGGQLSTVPPDELPPSAIPVKIPRASDGTLAAFDDHGRLLQVPGSVPSTTTLYLSPFAGEGGLEFGDSLKALGFGTEIRWLLYTNVNSESLRQLALTVPRIGALDGLPDEDVFRLFLAGEFAVGVGTTTNIGRVSLTVDGGRTGFGLHTDVGYLDPVALWNALNPGSPFTLIGTSWPYLTRTAATTPTVTTLFPMPVLHHARVAYELTDTQWRALGSTQKSLYWTRLRAKHGSGTASPFYFQPYDMANVFQLEALIEFYLAYPTPAQGGAVPTGATTIVDLTDPATPWHLVFLEPFVELLQSPVMIGPSYTLDPYPGAQGEYGPDRYDAVLLLVHNGVPKRWHRWSTYTAHAWMDNTGDTDKSSIVGNRMYSFKSRNASTTAAINYAFLVSDRVDANGLEACQGKYYYNPATPIPDDPDDKNAVMIHVGYTKTSTYAQNYNASAGCLVSPSFMRLRDQMLGFLGAGPDWNERLEALMGASLVESMQIFKPDVKAFESHGPSIIEAWNDKISGKLWLVRPDESTHK